MFRIILIATGFLLLLFEVYIQPISPQWQFIFFAAGIIILGIPHGAADLLVATQNAETEKKIFSRINFLVNYLFRLIVFGLLLYFIPVIGILFFIIFAAYHFGETDLYFLKTDTWPGKLLVSSYGLVLLSVILLSHPGELKELIILSGSNPGTVTLINFAGQYRTAGLSIVLLVLFSSIFLYFLQKKNTKAFVPDYFLGQFALLVFILYHLPFLLGFTFYFVVWHSALSLKNIITYLRENNRFPYRSILGQLGFYSFLAIGGMVLIGTAGFMFVSNQSIMMFTFLGLAVLTAPHMQVMHDMYKKIRGKHH